MNPASVRGLPAQEQPEKSRLAGSVAPDQPDPISGGDMEGTAGNNILAAE